MSKDYLFFVREEKDYAGDLITVLYVTPKDIFEDEKTIPDYYDDEDEEMIENVLTKVELEESSEWVFETYNLSSEDIEKELSKHSNFTKKNEFKEFILMGNGEIGN